MKPIIPKKCVCAKCGYTWISKLGYLPVQCSKCKSPNWNKKRKNAKK